MDICLRKREGVKRDSATTLESQRSIRKKEVPEENNKTQIKGHLREN